MILFPLQSSDNVLTNLHLFQTVKQGLKALQTFKLSIWQLLASVLVVVSRAVQSHAIKQGQLLLDTLCW